MSHPPAEHQEHAHRISQQIDEHRRLTIPRLHRLWEYYRNAPRPGAGLAQAQGLPQRLQPTAGIHREIVIENDISWRVMVLVDYMFGKPIAIRSLAGDCDRARTITRFLAEVFRANTGVTLLQDLALLGSVYGHADLLVRVKRGASLNLADPADAADRFVIELVDGRRGIPVIGSDDYRRLDGYITYVPHRADGTHKPGLLRRVKSQLSRSPHGLSDPAIQHHVQAWTASDITNYRIVDAGGKLQRLDTQRNRLGRVPVVHIQNIPQPLVYGGMSEVEALIPLQDELNTRLSDRANRITLQAFKMYLGRGIEQFTERPICPGQMWHTDNPDASIQEFGGDAHSPSEDAHIQEIRDAMDKSSGVSPIAAGVLRGKVGNLTSQNAIRLVLMGLLARIERKRVTYGGGIERLCELLLHAADVYGVFPNRPDERRVKIDWPDPIPENQAEQLDLARKKLDLGVPREAVFNELGYGDCGALS